MIAKDLTYVLAGKKAFVFRFANSVFGSKWSGFWSPPTKYLDYWALKVNDEWLSYVNCRDYADGVHTYGLNQPLEVREVQKIVDESKLEITLSIKNRSPTDINLQVDLEVGFNIRDFGENWHDRQYKGTMTSGVLMETQAGGLHITSNEKLTVVEQKYKDHTPGEYISQFGWTMFDEQKQRCLSTTMRVWRLLGPGAIHEIKFLFAPRGVTTATPVNLENPFSPDGFIEKVVDTMKTFAAERAGRFGFYAGFPYFTTFWGRDLSLMLPGYTRLGAFAEVRSALETLLASQDSNGLIANHDSDYASIDTTPLFLIALGDYINYSRDSGFVEKHETQIKKALAAFDYLDVNSDGLVEGDGASAFVNPPHTTTWMDSIERSEQPLEPQLFWALAFKAAARMFDKDSHLKKYINLKSKILNDYKRGDYFWDTLPTRGRSANPLFLTYYNELDLGEGQKLLDIIQKEFTRTAGVSTWSRIDSDYNPNSYHKGMVWGLLTNLAAVSCANYGLTDKALFYLDTIKQNLSRRCVNSIDEVYDGNNNPQGAVSQGWSVALIPQIYDALLGIKLDGSTLHLEPQLTTNWVRKLRVGSFTVDMRKQGEKITVEHLNKLDLVFAPPPGTTKLMINNQSMPVGRGTLKDFDRVEIVCR